MAAAEFNKERHIKYFLRCLRTLLPHQYTSGDSGRILLAFFIIAGLDLLGVLKTSTTPEERQRYIDWLYHCQHPSGGIRGFTGTIFGDEKRNRANEAWDPANLPSTFLALETLLLLGDDFSRLNRKGCLVWLRRLQRENGSFGETLGVDGEIEGGSDLRFCYCAAGIRYLLRGPRQKDVPGVEDIDAGKLVSFIQSSQSYEGGLAEASFCEAHAGHTYCGIGALSFLKRTDGDVHETELLRPQSEKFNALLSFLVSRQTTELEEEDEDDEEDGEHSDSEHPGPTTNPISEAKQAMEALSLNEKLENLPDLLPPDAASLAWAGFSGRSNKIADTCYCFWVTGAIDMIQQLPVINAPSVRRYLLEKTQHIIGGFGKSVGEPPDLYHAYLGMMSLALINEPGLETADATLCTGASLSRSLECLPWW